MSTQTATPPSAGTRKTGEELMAQAREKTGLTDFGPDSFREGLTRFLDAVDTELNVTEEKSDQIRGLALGRLVNRLEIAEYYRTHPELASLPIDGPLSITGLPRTGTTALCNILSLDDDFRSLRVWEQPKACPPPTLETEADDPRRLAAVQQYAYITQTQPELAAMHLWDADATEEDVELLGTDFHAQQLGLPIFGYHAWWRDTDMRPTFAYHRRVLQLLQSKRPPNRWLLKAPAHSFHLDAIVDAYPDARFVMTHRDPAKAVPSAISLVSALMPPGSLDEAAMAHFGQKHAEHLRIGVERAVEARKRVGEDRFLDIHHRDFIKDTFGTLDRIYAFLGIELRPHIRETMKQWHAANRTGAHGSHKYTAEQFGLSEAQLRSDFDFYIKRFDIQIEG